MMLCCFLFIWFSMCCMIDFGIGLVQFIELMFYMIDFSLVLLSSCRFLVLCVLYGKWNSGVCLLLIFFSSVLVLSICWCRVLLVVCESWVWVRLWLLIVQFFFIRLWLIFVIGLRLILLLVLILFRLWFILKNMFGMLQCLRMVIILLVQVLCGLLLKVSIMVLVGRLWLKILWLLFFIDIGYGLIILQLCRIVLWLQFLCRWVMQLFYFLCFSLMVCVCLKWLKMWVSFWLQLCLILLSVFRFLLMCWCSFIVGSEELVLICLCRLCSILWKVR